METLAKTYDFRGNQTLLDQEHCRFSMSLHELKRIRVGTIQKQTVPDGKAPFYTRTIILKSHGPTSFRLTLFADTADDLIVEFGG